MDALLTMSPQALIAQLLIGLINGSFYAVLSLGLAIIFGLLNVINFAHGALYMLGAFVAWVGMTQLGPWLGQPDLVVNYWLALGLAPLVVAVFGMAIERTMLRRLYRLDHLYGLLFTFGLALVLEGLFTHWYGAAGQSYAVPAALSGPVRLEQLQIVLPKYRLWVVLASAAVCFVTWWAIEKTKLGAYMRAGTENPKLLKAFGVNVPLLITLTYGYGVFLAGFAGVLAAPVFQVSPLMGSNLIIIVFAVVVIGGMGSIGGAILTGLALGLVEGLSKVIYPQASAITIFVIMAIVLMVKPAGLFGKTA
ncbi:branched-chain amino acid ABC transporter permease [Pseudorhodoferax soli]|uniref:Amino acid/amide ABC transporter membrane protein 1 (HAAT family) n=1 Tax=Pseudorhodoferax soli TaxID=545864 RepID=A0A368XLT3_9BURK|nr:branched-chain amino acid ABC transporter permease [Pseudorhodoferax soli]RCW68519.1 amino acid/amide ABC transporter membrane protein 1 (HAAT family) [Pseudorhodoferax soli]